MSRTRADRAPAPTIAPRAITPEARRRRGSRVAWAAWLLVALAGCGLGRESMLPEVAREVWEPVGRAEVPAAVDGPLPLTEALKRAGPGEPADLKSRDDSQPTRDEALARTTSESAAEDRDPGRAWPASPSPPAPAPPRPFPLEEVRGDGPRESPEPHPNPLPEGEGTRPVPSSRPADPGRSPIELPSPLGPLPAAEDLVPPLPDAPPGPSIPPPEATYPIDLPTALRLAEAENPTIGAARARIASALGQLSFDRTKILPTINAGTSYHGHQGNLQRSSGEIFNLSEQAFYVGGGAFTVAAETMRIPMLNVVGPLADIFYDPLAARQRLDRTRFDAAATANDVLLGVAGDYLDIQAARARIAARRRTEAEGAEVSRITANYARTGEGREADARRAETRRLQWRAEIRSAEEDAAVAASRLARRLHLDPSVRLAPLGDPLTTFPLVDLDRPLEDLLALALERRPEIQATAANVSEMRTRLDQEYARPFLPTVWLGFSGGGFGGGSNRVPSLLGNFGGRTDFDARVFWTVQNFGLGNLATQKRRRAIVAEALADRGKAVARVRREVASARGEALAARQRIAIARGELAAAEDGFRKDLERIKAAAGTPLEVLDNLKALRKARDQFIDAILGYNRAQFGLFVALGSPPPLDGPATPPPAEAAAILGDPATTTKPPATAGATSAGPPPTVPPLAASTDPAPAVVEAGALAPVARAHEAAVKAMLDYDRLQARLGRQLDDRKVDPEVLRAGLSELAESHRRALQAELDYDRAVRAAMTDLDRRPVEPVPRASATRPPSSDGRGDSGAPGLEITAP